MMKDKKDCARHQFPALELWWDELRAGKRTPETFDPLWAAACEETTATEWSATGLSGVAETNRTYARRAIRQRVVTT